MRTTHGRFHVNRPMWFASFRYCIGFRLTTMTFSIFDRAHVCIHEHKSKKNPSWLLHAPKICDSEYPSQELNLRLTFYKNVALTTELEGWNTGGEGTKKNPPPVSIKEEPYGSCPKRESNPHVVRQRILNASRLPISPSGQWHDGGTCVFVLTERPIDFRTTLPACKSTKVRDWRKLIFLFTKFFLKVWRVCFAGVA